MEEIHVSPTPTPPMQEPDGGDLCIIDVNDVAIDVVTVLICLCGLVGNGAIIWFLGFRIRKKPLTIYNLNVAISDVVFLLFAITLSFLYMIENIFCIPIVFLKQVRWLFLLSIFSCYIDFFFLAAISIERCVSILRPSSRRHRPHWLTAVVCVLSWVISFAVMAAMASLCMLHEYEQCKTALIITFVLNIIIFAAPLVISDVILCIKVLHDSQQRQRRRLYIVPFLTDLFFLVFALPLRIFVFVQLFVSLLLSFKIAFLIISITNTFCPFLYFLVACCQRLCSLVSLQVTFRRVFEELEDNSTHNNQMCMDRLNPAS